MPHGVKQTLQDNMNKSAKLIAQAIIECSKILSFRASLASQVESALFLVPVLLPDLPHPLCKILPVEDPICVARSKSKGRQASRVASMMGGPVLSKTAYTCHDPVSAK